MGDYCDHHWNDCLVNNAKVETDGSGHCRMEWECEKCGDSRSTTLVWQPVAAEGIFKLIGRAALFGPELIGATKENAPTGEAVPLDENGELWKGANRG